MRQQIHMSASVEGALRNKAFYGFEDDNGNEISPFEAKQILLEMKAKGITLFVMNRNCDNQKDGLCLGHPIPD